MAAKAARSDEARDGVLARLSRIEGQVRGIRRMVDEDRPCGEVLTQLRSAINALCRVQDHVLHRHLRRCLLEGFEAEGTEERARKAEEVFLLLGRYREP